MKYKCLFFVFIIFSLPLFSKNQPSIEPLFSIEKLLKHDGTEAVEPYGLSPDELFKLTLLFSECPLESETAKKCIVKFEKIKKEISSDSYMKLSAEARGKAVLKLLYRDYLVSYGLDQTKIDVALESGVYNCVSSALLYMSAAKSCGLDVRGQKTTNHVFCSIYVPDQKTGKTKKIDVETTNPYGFNPGGREAIENESEIKQYYIVPKKYYANRQEVSDLVFAGTIAGNICYECIKKGDYMRALPIGAARYEAVREEKSKASLEVRREFDVLAANFVGINPNSSALFSETVEWYTSFIDRWGMTDFLQKNMDNALNNLMVLCSKEKNFPFAQESFNRFKKYVTEKQTKKSEGMLADILYSSRTMGMTYENQIVEINNILEMEEYQTSSYQKSGRQYLENAWLMILNDFMNQKDYQKGMQKADEALLSLPQSSKIKNMRHNFYNNSIVIIHNNFVKKANSGLYNEAQQILEEGLSLFPNDKTLKKDLNDLLKIIGQ